MYIKCEDNIEYEIHIDTRYYGIEAVKAVTVKADRRLTVDNLIVRGERLTGTGLGKAKADQRLLLLGGGKRSQVTIRLEEVVCTDSVCFHTVLLTSRKKLSI